MLPLVLFHSEMLFAPNQEGSSQNESSGDYEDVNTLEENWPAVDMLHPVRRRRDLLRERPTAHSARRRRHARDYQNLKLYVWMRERTWNDQAESRSNGKVVD